LAAIINAANEARSTPIRRPHAPNLDPLWSMLDWEIGRLRHKLVPQTRLRGLAVRAHAPIGANMLVESGSVVATKKGSRASEDRDLES
jgi:hypothetical protein